MLIELRIRNVAVIDTVSLPLAAGLNVLSGETGAGKSLIVGALSFLLGERAASDRIRSGADRASVEGVFDIGADAALRALLDERGVEVDESYLVLRREVASTGRSRAWINGNAVTAGMLADIGGRLVSVHGQHDSRLLLDADTQRAVVDEFAGATGAAAMVRERHHALAEQRARLRELYARRQAAAARSDYLRFVVAEIDDAALRVGEDDALEGDMKRLAHAAELHAHARLAADLLAGEEGGVAEPLHAVRRAVASIARIDESAARMQSVVDDVQLTLDELARDLAAYAEGIDADPARLAAVQARREQIHAILRKHGPTVDDAMRVADEARAQLVLVDDGDAAIADAERGVAAATTALQESAATLTALRAEARTRLGGDVSALLPELGMEGGRFDVVLEPLAEIGPSGAERIRLDAALDRGSESRPLARIASGGELSRLMLALSTVLARVQQVPTLVFDEIDAGIGGAVAWQVGALMQRVAAHHQVLSISHLAQIAAHAHHHVVVQKGAQAGVTTADTTVVEGDARIAEIARMLGGDADREVSRAHARELLERGARSSNGDTNSRVDTVASRDVRLDATGPTPAKPKAPSAQRRGKPV